MKEMPGRERRKASPIGDTDDPGTGSISKTTNFIRRLEL